MDTQRYDLFFVNRSTAGGVACVFQDTANVLPSNANCRMLAWMVCAADSGVQIDFQWQVAYDFAWFNRGPVASQETQAAGAGAVTFSLGQYGYRFTDATPVSGVLSIQCDASIPSVNDATVGIGMSGAGTFGCPAQPGAKMTFSPVADASLLYWVAFGSDFVLGSPIDPETLAYAPLEVVYPPGVHAMTVTLTAANTLVLSNGAPSGGVANEPRACRKVVYRAGDAH